MRPAGRISTYMSFWIKFWSYFVGTTCSVDATLTNVRWDFRRDLASPLLARWSNYHPAPRLRLAGWVYYSKNWRRAAKFAAAVLPEPDYRAGATENGDGALAGGIDAAHDKAREIPATVKQPTRAGSDELRENLRTAAFAD